MKGKFKKDNYYQISGWMITDLNLSGNELLIYAIIYGFSQDGNSQFTGSLSYLQSATNASRNTVINTLKSLVSKNLIERHEVNINGVVFIKYNYTSAISAPLVQINKNTSAIFDTGSAISAPNNNIYNNINKDILSEQSSDDRKLLNLDVSNESYEVKLTKSFFDLFKNNLISCGRKSFTTYDNTKLSSWLVHIKRMIEVDGVTRNEFLEIYNWLKSDYKESNFWKSNIVSTQKLREKFGQLQVAMNKDLQTIKKDDKKKVDKTKNTTMGL